MPAEQSPIIMAWRVSEKTPEINDCEAMIVAAAASPTMGMSAQSGASL